MEAKIKMQLVFLHPIAVTMKELYQQQEKKRKLL